MNWSRFLGVLVLFIFAFTLCSQGQGNTAVSDFQCGESVNTFATGLSDAGQVVGWVGLFEEGQGFIKKKGGPCELLPMVPDALATIPLSINDPGQIVGITLPGNRIQGSGFLYEKGVYTLLDYPDAGPTQEQQTCQTYAFSINNRGQIVGLYDQWRQENSRWVCDGPDKPFLREADGTFVTLPNPEGASGSVQANGINPRGSIIGNYLSGGNEYGYARHPDGTVRTIMPEGAVDTMTTGINPQGQIVGRYFTESWLDAIGPCHGFLLDPKDAVPVEIKYPEAEFTCVGAINAAGEVSGAFSKNGSWHGFVEDVNVLIKAAQ